MSEPVKANWMHRLLSVVMGLILLLVSAISLIVAHESASEFKQFYSWRPGGIPAEFSGNAKRCESHRYELVDGMITGCGDFDSASALIEDMVENKAFSRAMIPTPRSRSSDELYAEAIIRSYDARYSYGHVFSWKLALRNYTKALGVIALTVAALGLAYSLILWIAHGTTRIAK